MNNNQLATYKQARQDLYNHLSSLGNIEITRKSMRPFDGALDYTVMDDGDGDIFTLSGGDVISIRFTKGEFFLITGLNAFKLGDIPQSNLDSILDVISESLGS